MCTYRPAFVCPSIGQNHFLSCFLKVNTHYCVTFPVAIVTETQRKGVLILVGGLRGYRPLWKGSDSTGSTGSSWSRDVGIIEIQRDAYVQFNYSFPLFIHAGTSA